jgi:hypothetical protein
MKVMRFCRGVEEDGDLDGKERKGGGVGGFG